MGAAMRFLSSWDDVLGWMSRALGTEDREAVLGDLAEEGASTLRSIISVTDLMLRREFAEWNAFTTWAVFLLMLVPSVILLAVVSQNLADGSAIYVWLFANNWDEYLLHQPAFWRGLGDFLPDQVISAVALMSWSWSCGLVVGLASPRTIQTSRMWICLSGACCGWASSTFHIAHFLWGVHESIRETAQSSVTCSIAASFHSSSNFCSCFFRYGGD